jgi:hypothetical protein
MAETNDIVITLIREAITALKDKNLTPDEASALFRGLAEALHAITDLIPSWWGKAVIKTAATICEQAAEGFEQHGNDS